MTLDPRAEAQRYELFKYPRTRHLESSRLQFGDSAHDQLAYRDLQGRHIVVEEKLDGANAAVSFSEAGELLLQSRGHYLTGGSRERQFSMFKQWAACHEAWLLDRLQDRYVMFGEVLSKTHSVFYDRLPHLFCEFDVYDRRSGRFLSTAARTELLQGGPVLPVPVLYAGVAPRRLADLLDLVGPSLARSSQWRERFVEAVQREGHDPERAWARLDKSEHMEGLYLKIEDQAQTLERAKWVRADFVQAIMEAGEHHLRQPYVGNGLAAGVDLYAPQPTVTWQTLKEDC